MLLDRGHAAMCTLLLFSVVHENAPPKNQGRRSPTSTGIYHLQALNMLLRCSIKPCKVGLCHNTDCIEHRGQNSSVSSVLGYQTTGAASQV